MFKFVFLISVLFFISCSAPRQRIDELSVQPSIPRPEQNLVFSRFGSAKANSELITAWRLYRSGKFRQSAQAFEEMISNGYVHYDTAFGAGLAYMKYYDNEKSLRYFSQAVSLNPLHFEALFFIAEIKKQNKDYASARYYLEKVLSADFEGKLICGSVDKDYLSRKDFEKRKKDSLIMLKQM
ncbi:MAG: tetratricopeptide repeat protein [Spirochaetes bacterium]|nr:tetratricopeptide repeat protein [Spirochaetota bacterium]